METVVVQVVGDNELSDGIFWFGVIEFCGKSKADLLVDPLEEVFLRWLWHQLVNVAQRVLLRADSVMGRYDDSWLALSMGLMSIQVVRLVDAELFGIVISGGLVASLQKVALAKDNQSLPDE